MSKPLLVLITEYTALTQLGKVLFVVSWSPPALYFHVCLLHSDSLRAFFYKVSYFFLIEIKENRICSGDPKMELKVAFVPP